MVSNGEIIEEYFHVPQKNVFLSGGTRRLRAVALAALLLLAAGCAPGPSPTAADAGATSTGSALADWRPSTPIPVVVMSDSERKHLNDLRLQNLAEMLHVSDPPHVEAVRWIYPEEIGSVVGGCLREAGFVVSPAADGRGFQADAGTEAQLPILNLEWYRCSAMYPTDPRARGNSWTIAQETIAYEYLTEALIPCLKDIGADPLDAPSLSVYLADQASWRYPDPGGQQTQQIWFRSCPPSPPTRAILGEG